MEHINGLIYCNIWLCVSKKNVSSDQIFLLSVSIMATYLQSIKNFYMVPDISLSHLICISCEFNFIVQIIFIIFCSLYLYFSETLSLWKLESQKWTSERETHSQKRGREPKLERVRGGETESKKRERKTWEGQSKKWGREKVGEKVRVKQKWVPKWEDKRKRVKSERVSYDICC